MTIKSMLDRLAKLGDLVAERPNPTNASPYENRQQRRARERREKKAALRQRRMEAKT